MVFEWILLRMDGRGIDGQMQCIDSMLCNGHRPCSKTGIVPPQRAGVLRFGGLLGRFIEHAHVCFVWFYWLCLCVLCESPFIGASKQPSIDPLDLLDVFCRDALCLESTMYSLYTLARSDHEAIRLSVVCMV